jgi:hypothetical protein
MEKMLVSKSFKEPYFDIYLDEEDIDIDELKIEKK